MNEKMIFDFEAAPAPVLTARMLEKERERRRLQRQTTLLVIGAVFAELCLLLTGLLLKEIYPMAAIVCIVYVLFSSAGGGAVAAVFHVRRRDILWQ